MKVLIVAVLAKCGLSETWCDPLMILPPAEDIPITVEILADTDGTELAQGKWPCQPECYLRLL